MKHLLSTTAIVLLTALPVQAEQHTGAGMNAETSVMLGEDQLRVSNLLDASVYMPGEGGDGSMAAGMELAEIPSDWTEIGTVEDIFVNEDGDIATLVVSPSGGVETDADRVGLKPESFTFAWVSGEDGEVAIIYTGDKASFESAEEFDQAMAEDMGEKPAMSDMTDDETGDLSDDLEDAAEDAGEATADAAEDVGEATAEAAEDVGEATAEAAEDVAAAANDAVAATEEAVDDMAGDDMFDPSAITAEELDGAPVYDVTGDEIGEISEIIVTDDGMIERVVIDVGGFLGIGEKPVALTFDELKISQGEGMNALRIEVDYTEEELENMENWEG